ncbi:MAG: hypothetical protein Q6352_008910 [Candidatus Freyrarchaeum guaymaensis]
MSKKNERLLLESYFEYKKNKYIPMYKDVINYPTVGPGIELEKGNDFKTLLEQLEQMNETQKVDISVVKVLDSLIEDCRTNERFWIKNEKIPIETSFLLYHSTRNSRLILEKMKQRFILADEKEDNPHIVSDALQVVPVLNELYEVISALKYLEIKTELLSFLSSKLRQLRNVASIASMIPSPEEEIKEIDKKKLKRRFSRFADTIQVIFIED